jgi:pimeloyl-ACP methyl ester carboxylesterase
VVVFVHGLAADESCWQRGSLRAWGREGLDYGHWLAERRGVTPLYVRYNSGLPIADNGRALATLLAQLLAAYPGDLQSLVLLGHSMGGLVARSAWRFGRADGHAWTDHVRDLICLGAPHRGAVLEKVGAATAVALGLFDVTAPIARAIDGRSAGIKDLRHGIGDDEPTPAGPRVHHLAGTLGRPGTPLAWALGDGLVRVASAVPRRGAGARTATIAGLNHITMLNHPAVLEWLEAALAEPSLSASD